MDELNELLWAGAATEDSTYVYFCMMKFMICIPFCAAANYTDCRELRIPNRLTLALLIAGLALNITAAIVFSDRSSLLNLCSLLALYAADWFTGLLPAFALLPFYCLKMIGAGDIKFLSALGGMTGWKYSAAVICFSLIASGVIGACVLLYRGTLKKRMRIVSRYLKICLFTHSVIPYSAAESGDDPSGRFAFSYGITVGVIAAAVIFFRMNFSML